MTTHAMAFETGRKDWRTAISAVRKLLADADDTVQVFRIMQALNAGTAKAGYDKLLRTEAGGRIAYERVELAVRLSDPAFVAGFAPGTVGGAYRAFLEKTGYSAEGLAQVSREAGVARDAVHPYAWFGRRSRDTHDLWHIVTGYKADDPLGEACLVAFSYAQNGGLGWALIAVAAALRALGMPGGLLAARAIWEGYAHGRKAAWLPGEDYEALLAEPLDEARRRLGIREPVLYRRIAG